jgi:transcriptional regulator with XRE-family HTH domain
MASFRTAVAEMRKAARLTQAELARRIGTSQSVIARWEAQQVSPSLSTVERIAHACGFDPSVIWTARPQVDRSQIAARLSWTPRERLDYLLDMLAFESRARIAKRLKRP